MSEGLIIPGVLELSSGDMETADIGLIKDWLRIFDIKHLDGHLAILKDKDWTAAALFSQKTIETSIEEIENELEELLNSEDPYCEMDEMAIRARYNSLMNEVSLI